MAKLDEILTQISDLNPEVEYRLEVSEDCVKLSTPATETQNTEVENLKSEVEKLKKANMQLLSQTVVEEDRRVEDILYDMFGKPRKGVNG